MDFFNDNNNNDGLYGARNENSVLFSLDNLNAMEKDSENEGGLNTNSEASGLINLNMLSQMGSSSGPMDDYSGYSGSAPVMGSMSFNQVRAQKSQRMLIIAVIVGILVFIGIGAGVYMIYSSGQEELARLQKKAEEEKAAQAEELKKQEEEAAAREKELQQQITDAQVRKADEERVAAEEAKLLAQREAAAAEEAKAAQAGGAGSGAGSKTTKTTKTTKPSGGDTAAAAAEPAPKPKPKGAGLDPNAVKAALADAGKKAAKCGKGGNLTISLTLQGSGTAKDVKAVSGSFKGSNTEKCIITVYEKYPFPKFSGNPVPGVKYTVKL